MERQAELKKDIGKHFEKYLEHMPELGEAYQLSSRAYQDGKLSARTKRLMAIAIAVASGCRGCILFQQNTPLIRELQ